MPQKTEYVVEQGIIVITYTGKVTINEAREATVEAIAIQKQKRTDRVLIDAFAMKAWPSLVEMWGLVQSYPELQPPPQTRLAAVRPQLPDDTDLSGFYETICQNRGYNAKVFETREAAAQWLQSGQNEHRPNVERG